MMDWHSQTDRVELFPEFLYEQVQFLVMWIRDGEPVPTAADPCEFLHHMSPDYAAAIMAAETLAQTNGLDVYDRVGEVQP